MSARLSAGVSVILALVICAGSAWAQRSGRDPYSGYVYPAGGRQGTSFQVTVGGQNLRGVNYAYVSVISGRESMA